MSPYTGLAKGLHRPVLVKVAETVHHLTVPTDDVIDRHSPHPWERSMSRSQWKAMPPSRRHVRPAKTLPTNLERRVFPDTQITAYRLAA